MTSPRRMVGSSKENIEKPRRARGRVAKGRVRLRYSEESEQSRRILEGCLEDFEREMRCAICLSVCRDPRSLKCSHFFCMSCLEALLLDEGENRCPMCKMPWNRRDLMQDESLLALSIGTRDLHDILLPDLDIPPMSQDITKEEVVKLCQVQHRNRRKPLDIISSNKRMKRTRHKDVPKMIVPEEQAEIMPDDRQTGRIENETPSRRAIAREKGLEAEVRTLRKSITDKSGKTPRGRFSRDIEWLRRKWTEISSESPNCEIQSTNKNRKKRTRGKPVTKGKSPRGRKGIRAHSKKPENKKIGTNCRNKSSLERIPESSSKSYQSENKPETKNAPDNSKYNFTDPYAECTEPSPKRFHTRVFSSRNGQRSGRIGVLQESGSRRTTRKQKNTIFSNMITPEPWNCPRCTYRNKAFETDCLICEFNMILQA